MQTLTEIRAMLAAAGLRPNRRLGQNFLIDHNLMAKLLALADPAGGSIVLEVGPGTGSLTEELLARCGKLVAVEADAGLAALLADRFADRENLLLIHGDVLAGKHEIAPAVTAGLGDEADLVANLPYRIATPLIGQCLIDSWHAGRGLQARCAFGRLSFTVQREVADRLAAPAGGAAYGPISVIVSVLGRLTPGPAVPASAFWPRPRVEGRIMRIDLDAAGAAGVADVDVLTSVLSLSFAQRRKQIGSIVRRKGSPLGPEAAAAALRAAEVDPTLRPQQVTPGQFVAMANSLSAE